MGVGGREIGCPDSDVQHLSKVENQMRSLLARFGIADFRPRLKKAPEHLEKLRTFDGRPLPPNTKARRNFSPRFPPPGSRNRAHRAKRDARRCGARRSLWRNVDLMGTEMLGFSPEITAWPGSSLRK